MYYNAEDQKHREEQVRQKGRDVGSLAQRLAQWKVTREQLDEFFDDTFMEMVMELETTAKALQESQR